MPVKNDIIRIEIDKNSSGKKTEEWIRFMEEGMSLQENRENKEKSVRWKAKVCLVCDEVKQILHKSQLGTDESSTEANEKCARCQKVHARLRKKPPCEMTPWFCKYFDLQYESEKKIFDKIVSDYQTFPICSPFVARIIAIYIAEEEPRRIGYTFHEYIDGQDMSEYVEDVLSKNKDIWKVNLIRHYIGLKFLYGIQTYLDIHSEEQIVHDDLKPENIMIGNDEFPQVKIVDLDSMYIPKKEGNDKRYGTPGYIHPKRVLTMGERKPEWDIYSAGLTLYYLWEGRTHFVQEDLCEADGLIVSEEMAYTLKDTPNIDINDQYIIDGTGCEKFRNIIKRMISNTETDEMAYKDIDQVIADYQKHLKCVYLQAYDKYFIFQEYLKVSEKKKETGTRVEFRITTVDRYQKKRSVIKPVECTEDSIWMMVEVKGMVRLAERKLQDNEKCFLVFMQKKDRADAISYVSMNEEVSVHSDIPHRADDIGETLMAGDHIKFGSIEIEVLKIMER
ncbi:MAG: hypothetical protein EOM40_05005 [Clostridia bacterium]|nr:hypothetical protein [Clostridia bacterium]NCC42103.1 hypothetical protein [Clostridia bacterium]